MKACGPVASREMGPFDAPFGAHTASSYRSVAIGGGMAWELHFTPTLSLRPQLRLAFGPAGDAAWVRTEAWVAVGYHW
jgi:hypothetical protein